MQYQQYVRSKDEATKEQYRYVRFRPDLIVDLRAKLELNNRYEPTQIMVVRNNDDNRVRLRPESMYREQELCTGEEAANPCEWCLDRQ